LLPSDTEIKNPSKGVVFMKKSIWISLAAFAIFVAGALAAIAIYISRNGSRLIGDDEYDDYDFDFDEDEDASDEYCGECAIDDDAQKSVVIEDNASEEK
jgi:hypothetical protein